MTQKVDINRDIKEEIFFEDFTSDTINRELWNVRVTGEIYNNEQQAYIDSTETVYIEPGRSDDANGVLVLQPKYKPNFITKEGNKFDFISGRIDTKEKVEFIQGKLSARIKMSAGPGLWPAFWMIGQGKWPGCGEIDIMEFVGESDWISSAVHGLGHSGDAALVNNFYFPKENDATNWHVYSINLQQNNSIEFSVDDKLIYRVNKPLIEYFGSWVYDEPKFIILNLAVGGGYPYKINGIKQPYFGLPEETVQAIKRNEVRFMVDWVRITQS